MQLAWRFVGINVSAFMRSSLIVVLDTDGFRQFMECFPEFRSLRTKKQCASLLFSVNVSKLPSLDQRPGFMMDLWKDRVGNHFIGIAISFILHDWTLHVVS